MLAIDRLIHAVHQDQPGGKAVTSPAAQNLIYAGPASIIKLLDELAYGDQAGPERMRIRAEFYLLSEIAGQKWGWVDARKKLPFPGKRVHSI